MSDRYTESKDLEFQSTQSVTDNHQSLHHHQLILAHPAI